jgi:hypothetical protein
MLPLPKFFITENPEDIYIIDTNNTKETSNNNQILNGLNIVKFFLNKICTEFLHTSASPDILTAIDKISQNV